MTNSRRSVRLLPPVMPRTIRLRRRACRHGPIPTRTLGALCNQAAVKLGDPSPIKEIIAQYVPEGQVAHSRNIPEDKRAEFVKAVEAKAGMNSPGNR
jgi:hypothetical protein